MRVLEKSFTDLHLAVTTVATQIGAVATAVTTDAVTVTTKGVRVVPVGAPGADGHKVLINWSIETKMPKVEASRRQQQVV
jgi:aconitase A